MKALQRKPAAARVPPLPARGEHEKASEAEDERLQGFCPCEGGCPKCLGLQAKLLVGPADDAYEREADRLAEKIVRAPEKHAVQSVTPVASPQVQCKPAPPHHAESNVAEAKPEIQSEEEEPLPEKTLTAAAVQGLEGRGEKLPKETRDYFESHLARDLHRVRIHAGSSDHALAQSVQARAWTWQNHIVFNQGEYAPKTQAGKQLLAHELAHVAQQSRSTFPPRIQRQTVAQAEKVVAQMVPNPPVPQMLCKQQDTTNQEVCALGPFLGFPDLGGQVTQTGNPLPLNNVDANYKDIKTIQEPFQRKTIVKMDQCIKNKCWQNKQPKESEFESFSRQMFGFRTAPKNRIGGETQWALKQGETEWKDWSKIGYVLPLPGSNPLYNWAAGLHEQQHSDTARQGFTNKIEARFMQAKQDILDRPLVQFYGATQAQMDQLKAALRPLQKPADIQNFIATQPLLAPTDRPSITSDIEREYVKWGNWAGEIVNHATDDLKAYCISWTALRRVMQFLEKIKPSLTKPQRRKR